MGGIGGSTSWSTRGIYQLVQFQPSISSCLSETCSMPLHWVPTMETHLALCCNWSVMASLSGRFQLLSSFVERNSSTFFTAACTYWEDLKAQNSTPVLSCTLLTDLPRYILGGPINSYFNVNYWQSSCCRICSTFFLKTGASLVYSKIYSFHYDTLLNLAGLIHKSGSAGKEINLRYLIQDWR